MDVSDRYFMTSNQAHQLWNNSVEQQPVKLVYNLTIPQYIRVMQLLPCVAGTEVLPGDEHLPEFIYRQTDSHVTRNRTIVAIVQ